MNTPAETGASPAASMFAALADRRYRRLWMANTVSGLGDWMQIFGRSALALRAGGGDPRAVGMVVFATYLPQVFGSMYGGALADRFDRRRLVMMTTAVQCVAAGAIGIGATTGHVTVAFLAVMSLLLGTAFTLFLPASQALLPSLVRKELIPSAVELGIFSNSLTRVVGPLIAGTLAATFGLEFVFYANAVSFLAVIGVWLTTRVEAHVPPTVRGKVVDAFRHIRSRPVLWVPMAISAVLSSVGVLYQPLSIVFASEVLMPGSQSRAETANSWLQAAIGIGAAIGISVLARWGRPRPRQTLLATGIAGSILLIAASFTAVTWLSALAFGAVGAALFANMTLAIALVQRHAPNEMRGRIMGIHMMGILGLIPVTAMAGSSLARAFGIQKVIAGTGFICFAFLLLATRFPIFDGDLAHDATPEEQIATGTVLAEEGS
ncbi:MAG: MFS transporter [Acidimicrobiia bacterium]